MILHHYQAEIILYLKSILTITLVQDYHLFFQKFFQVFQISSNFSKIQVFGFIFSLKLNLSLKTVLNSIKKCWKDTNKAT